MRCSLLKEDYENNELVYSIFSKPIRAQTGKIVGTYEMYFSEDYSEDYYVMEFDIIREYEDIIDLKKNVKSGNYHKDPREEEKRLTREKILEKYRSLDIPNVPTEMDIEKHIGKNAMENIEIIKNFLEKTIETKFELKYFAGGWAYRVSSKSKLLFNLFFQKNGIQIQLSSLKIKSKKDTEKYNELSEEGKKRWEKSKNGNLIIYRIENKKHLKDVMLFISIKINKEINIKEYVV